MRSRLPRLRRSERALQCCALRFADRFPYVYMQFRSIRLMSATANSGPSSSSAASSRNFTLDSPTWGLPLADGILGTVTEVGVA